MSVRPPSNGWAVTLTVGGILMSGVLTFGCWYHALAPIQQAYLPTFYRTEYLPSGSMLGLKPKPKRYAVLTVNGHDATLATMPQTMVGIGIRDTYTTPDLFSNWLKHAVFEDQSGWELLEVPLIVWAVFSFLFLIAGVIFAKQQKRKALEGVKLRGPDMMTVHQFNKVTKGDGFALQVKR